MRLVIMVSWTIQSLVPIYSAIHGKPYFFLSGFICLTTLNTELLQHKMMYWTQWVFRLTLTFIMLACYITIFCVAHKNRPTRLAKILNKSSVVSIDDEHSPHGKHKNQGRFMERLRDHNREIKVASTVAIVIATFGLSWLPTFIAELTYFPNSVDFLTSYSLTAHIVFWAIYISPSLNPIIYALHNTRIRGYVIQFLKGQRLQKSFSSTYVVSTKGNVTDNIDYVRHVNPVTPCDRTRKRSIVDMIGLTNFLKGSNYENNLGIMSERTGSTRSVLNDETNQIVTNTLSTASQRLAKLDSLNDITSISADTT